MNQLVTETGDRRRTVLGRLLPRPGREGCVARWHSSGDPKRVQKLPDSPVSLELIERRYCVLLLVDDKMRPCQTLKGRVSEQHSPLDRPSVQVGFGIPVDNFTQYRLPVRV